MQRFARRKLNYFRLNALKSKRIMQEPMAMENLLRWFMDGDAGEDKEDSLASSYTASCVCIYI